MAATKPDSKLRQTSIPVYEQTRDLARSQKPNGMTWDEYIRELVKNDL